MSKNELAKEMIELLKLLSKNPEHRKVILMLLEGLLEDKSSN